MQGSAEEVNIQASELNRTMKVMVKFLVDNTGLSQDEVEMEIDRETFLSTCPCLTPDTNYEQCTF
jgi:ATP-dependent Clp protease protease subunit